MPPQLHPHVNLAYILIADERSKEENFRVREHDLAARGIMLMRADLAADESNPRESGDEVWKELNKAVSSSPRSQFDMAPEPL